MKSEVRDEVEAVLSIQKEKTAAAVGPDQVKNEVRKEMGAAVKEERDKVYRARNLMLTNIPEPDTDDMEIGKAADLENVT